jgi:hypothetical protein
VRRGQLAERVPGVERREQLAVLVLAPRLAGSRRQLGLAPLELRGALERLRRGEQRPHHLRPLVGALGGKYFARFRVDAVGERLHDRQCLCLFHVHHPLSAPATCAAR